MHMSVLAYVCCVLVCCACCGVCACHLCACAMLHIPYLVVPSECAAFGLIELHKLLDSVSESLFCFRTPPLHKGVIIAPMLVCFLQRVTIAQHSSIPTLRIGLCLCWCVDVYFF